MKIENYIQLGSLQEQKVLLRASNYFDGVVLKASLVSNFPSATFSFLQKLSIPFFIDPMTYVFTIDHRFMLDADEEETRPVFVELAERYSPMFSRAIESQVPVNPAELTDSDIDDISHNVIAFERGAFDNVTGDDFFSVLLTEMSPIKMKFVVAPYFFPTENSIESVLKANLRFIASCRNQARDVATFVPVIRAVLRDSSEIGRLIESYSQSGARHFVIWLDGIDELSITEYELGNLVALIQGLSSAGDVFNYYGGFLSTLLTKVGLSGFGYGPGYSESRGYMPVKGMAPTPMFYLYAAHRRFKVDELLDFFGGLDEQTFLSLSGNSPICQKLLQQTKSVVGAVSSFAEIERQVRFKIKDRSGQSVDRAKTIYRSRSQLIARYHFLFCKNAETDLVNADNFEVLLRRLSDDRKRLESTGFPKLEVMDRWLALASAIKKHS